MNLLNQALAEFTLKILEITKSDALAGVRSDPSDFMPDILESVCNHCSNQDFKASVWKEFLGLVGNDVDKWFDANYDIHSKTV